MSSAGCEMIAHMKVLLLRCVHRGSKPWTWWGLVGGVAAALVLSGAPPASADFICWAVGAGGTIIHTSDGGSTRAPPTSATGRILEGVASPATKNGWAVGQSGTILHTIAGGSSWSPQTSGTSNLLTRVAFPTTLDGWAVGQNGTI